MKNLVQSAIGALGEALIWIRDNIQDDEMRRGVMIDLGLDPDANPDAQLPTDPLDGIQQYRNAVDPDEAALHHALLDIRTLVISFKNYFQIFVLDPGNDSNLDKIIWNFFQIMGTNYVRLRYPHVFWLLQLAGFLGDFKEVREHTPVLLFTGIRHGVQLTGGTVVFVLKNLWKFLSGPIDYFRDVHKHLVDAGYPSMETTKDAQAWSYLFLAFSVFLAILKETQEDGPTSRFLYSWLAMPVDEEGKTPEQIEEERRGPWVDQLSDGAFSFDYRFSKGTVQEYLGLTMMFVSQEDMPTDIGAEFGVQYPVSAALFLSLNGEVDIDIPLSDYADLNINIDSGNLLDFFIPASGGGTDMNVAGDGKVAVSLVRRRDPITGASFALPGSTGSRLTIGNIYLSAFANFQDQGMEICLEDNAIVIDGSGADGFLQEVLPDGEAHMHYTVRFGFSRQKGFYFKHDLGLIDDLLAEAEKAPPPTPLPSNTGQPGGPPKKKTPAIETMFPIHKDMGIARFESIDWSYGGTKKKDHFGLNLSVRTTFSAKMGPLFLQVQKIGVGLDLSVPKEGDDITQTDLSLGFLFPKGVGIRVDSKVVTGGGFIEFDPENHRYAGVLSLNFQSIELSAVGLISTRLPNNQDGFSMLISISVLFKPGLQLPFGYKLDGVGGLIGIHRSMRVEELRKRISKGVINSIMFPKDVIKNAPKIISNLRAVFPPEYKHYIIAPFLKISWGTPTVGEIDLGVLVELPFNDRVVLIGSIGLYVPNKKAPKPLIEIHIDILGDFNFAASYILIEGKLKKSKVAGISLKGGFAYMLDWGEEKQFLMSVGGYHPRYQKPSRFPKVDRLSALIKKGENMVLTCQYYQAITSNSYQIGFKADLLIKWKGATITGWFEFNALLQVNPVLFEADIHLGVSVKYKGRNLAGIDLYFLLSGPKPWHAKGYAKLKILFFTLKVKFNHTWGGEQEALQVRVAPMEVFGQLQQELDEPRNWTAKLPAGFSNAESLRSLDESETAGLLMAHPSGFLEVRQTAIPLEKTIEKIGTTDVSDNPSFRINGYEIGEGAQKITVSGQDQIALHEYFSRGQYEELNDAEKIFYPGFQPDESWGDI